MGLREIAGRLLAWRRRATLDRDLAADLETHIELLARDLEHDGLSRADALAAARRRLGNVTGVRERSRDAWGFPALDAVAQDVRYAIRGLRRSPGFTATAIITLALGIGANAAIFGVIDRVMFRPYPYLRDPGAVNRVYTETTYRGRVGANMVFPWLRYTDLRDAAPIGTFGAETEWRFAVGTGVESRVKKVAGLSASLVAFFDATPVRGRWFQPAEDVPPSGTPVAVISYAMWQSDFGGAEVVGKSLKVGIIDYTIIGVAPPGFVGAAAGGAPDVFVPITTIPGNLGAWSVDSYRVNYSWDWVQVFVRRNPGVGEAAATAALTDAYSRSRAKQRVLVPTVLPDSIAHPHGIAGPVKQAAGPGAGRESRVLLWVTGVAFIVLIIACANVANLMFARVIRRRREVSVRLALGVRRGRLVMQFLVEGLVLAVIGTVVGLAVAQWGGVAIRTLLLPDGTPFNLADDWRTLGVAAACATAAALLTTIGPALMAARGDVAASLKAGAREGTYHRSTTRAALLVLQGALSVLLLVGAGLFVRSFGNARAVPLGYDAHPVLQVVLDYRGYAMDSAKAVPERERMLAAARAIPGVVAAARVNSNLFGTNTSELFVDGVDSLGALGRFNMQVASPSYFDVMQIRILRGRAFDERDRDGAPLVAVVSESMAHVLWPNQDALGKCLYVGGGGMPTGARGPCRTVIGVAENTAQQNITDDPRFMYYMPVAQRWPNSVSTIYVRVAAPDARGEMERVRRELTRAMPGDGFVVVRPLQEVVDDQSRSWRLGASLFVAFGGLALAVALVGLYGVISYNVAQRTHEIGVRVALGARAADVVRLILGQGMRLAGLGVAIGLVVALGAARWVQPMLFNLSAKDPATYVAVAGAMLIAALMACLVPAMRAARADPNVALRSD
ncbi:MAG TPA: ABC transporter permease, partial [Gemmatimonadaceae bacterium]|nr:ABC transporter permease [Gemmatimonadaceae bacterium]